MGFSRKNRDAEIRRRLADNYSQSVRVQNESLKTGLGLECSGLIHESQWGVSTSRNSLYFGLGAFEERNLHQKNVPNNSAYNKVSRPSRL